MFVRKKNEDNYRYNLANSHKYQKSLEVMGIFHEEENQTACDKKIPKDVKENKLRNKGYFIVKKNVNRATYLGRDKKLAKQPKPH